MMPTCTRARDVANDEVRGVFDQVQECEDGMLQHFLSRATLYGVDKREHLLQAADQTLQVIVLPLEPLEVLLSE